MLPIQENGSTNIIFCCISSVMLQSDGSPDMTYFAPDCFHLSQKGHGVGALYLWKNMASYMELNGSNNS